MPGRVLARIAERRGLTLQQRPPLYRYRPTEAELADLRQALSGGALSRERVHWDDAAAFCLYAAATFCREHRGGPWQWETVLERVGFSGGPGARLYNILEVGMGHLGRRIRYVGRSRRFLATIAAEGGLPLQLLRNEQHGLARYVRRVLHGYETHEVPAAELAESWSSELPSSLRSDEVFQVVGCLVEAVAALRERIPPGTADPVAYLDHESPGWRDELPLDMGDTVARDLLLGLLRAPLAVRSERPFVSSEIVLVPQDAGTRWRIERHVLIRSSVSADALTRLLGIDPPGRFRIAAETGGEREELALVSRVGSTFVAQRLRPGVFREPRLVEGRAEIVAYLGARDLGRSAVPGGDALDGNAPWVFAERGERFLLVGVGSTRGSDRPYLVALPQGGVLPAGPTVRGEILGSSTPRSLVELAARTEIDLDGERYVFEPGDPGSPLARVELRGARTTLGPTGDQVWVGAPRPVEVDALGRDRPLGGTVEWRPARGGAWKTTDPAGEVIIRVTAGGVVRLRERATVLPKSFRFVLRPDGPARGALELRGLGARSVTPRVERGRATERRAQDLVEVSCECSTREPQGRIALDVLLADGAEATLHATSPVHCAAFLSGSGLPAGPLATLERLGALRAFVVPPSNRSEYSLDAKIVARPNSGAHAGKSPSVHIARLVRDERGGASLPLAAFAEQVAGMLASNPLAMNGEVRLDIVEDGGSAAPLASLRVAHYEAGLEPIPPRGGGEKKIVVQDWTGARDAILVRAQPLIAPAADARVDLPKAAPGEFVWDPAARRGLWLLTGWIGELSVTRPLRMQGAQDAAASNPLDACVLERDEARRAAAFDGVIARLAENGADPDWLRAHEYLESTRALPVRTYDFVRRFVRNPEAVALAALHLPSFEPVATALEQLPFLWCLVPLRAWAKAFRRHGASLAGAPGAAPDRDLLSALEALAPLLSWSGVIRDVLLPRPEGGVPRRNAAEIDLGEALQHLRRGHSDERWPQDAPNADELGLAAEWCRLVDQRRNRPPVSTEEAVARAPAVAAAVVASGRVLTSEQVARFQRVRAFDEAYFDHALELHVSQFLPSIQDPEIRP